MLPGVSKQTIALRNAIGMPGSKGPGWHSGFIVLQGLQFSIFVIVRNPSLEGAIIILAKQMNANHRLLGNETFL